jgi:predicted acyltransferase
VTHHGARLASLDVFRGVTVSSMILVNNPGNWSGVFESLTHADWNGCTLADLVFPFFIFILGAAMPFAFARRIERGHARRDLYLRIARRSAWLVALGLMLNVVVATPAVMAMRFPGVLQRIGLVYLIAAPIVIHQRPAWRAATISALVLGHWALLVAPISAAAGGLGHAHTLAEHVDRAVFGRHILTTTGDPEGLLGTIPTVATALLGSIAGDWLRKAASIPLRVGGLVLGGIVALVVGIVWTPALPLNKALWTGSFVLVTAGLAALVLAACYVMFDVYDYRRFARPFLWLGLNPLAIYSLAELLGHLLDVPWPRGAAQPMTVRAWAFWSILRPLMPGPRDEWISLMFALLTVLWWMAVAGVLYRRDIRLQV